MDEDDQVKVEETMLTSPASSSTLIGGDTPFGDIQDNNDNQDDKNKAQSLCSSVGVPPAKRLKSDKCPLHIDDKIDTNTNINDVNTAQATATAATATTTPEPNKRKRRAAPRPRIYKPNPNDASPAITNAQHEMNQKAIAVGRASYIAAKIAALEAISYGDGDDEDGKDDDENDEDEDGKDDEHDKDDDGHDGHGSET
jgi:hypothetical protein